MYTHMKRVEKENYIEYTATKNYKNDNSSSRAETGVKSLKSLNRAKNKIKEIIMLNVEKNTAFITLTYAENLQDHTISSKLFDLFIKRYRYIQKDLKYLSVVEYQKRGAIHYHLMVFNYKGHDISKLWDHGFSYVKRLTEWHDSDKVSNYMGKYLSKQSIEFNKKLYTASRNCKRIVRENVNPIWLPILKNKASIDISSDYHNILIIKKENDIFA